MARSKALALALRQFVEVRGGWQLEDAQVSAIEMNLVTGGPPREVTGQVKSCFETFRRYRFPGTVPTVSSSRCGQPHLRFCCADATLEWCSSTACRLRASCPTCGLREIRMKLFDSWGKCGGPTGARWNRLATLAAAQGRAQAFGVKPVQTEKCIGASSQLLNRRPANPPRAPRVRWTPSRA
jgi:hypothetical protein